MFFLQNISRSLNILHAMSIADRFLLDMEYDEGLALVPETNMNAWMEDPRPGPNLHAKLDLTRRSFKLEVAGGFLRPSRQTEFRATR